MVSTDHKQTNSVEFVIKIPLSKDLKILYKISRKWLILQNIFPIILHK